MKLKILLLYVAANLAFGCPVHADDEPLIASSRTFAQERIHETGNSEESARFCFERALDAGKQTGGGFSKIRVVRAGDTAQKVVFEHDGGPYDGCHCEVVVMIDEQGRPASAHPKIIKCVGG